jgi:hypothetical protein
MKVNLQYLSTDSIVVVFIKLCYFRAFYIDLIIDLVSVCQYIFILEYEIFKQARL